MLPAVTAGDIRSRNLNQKNLYTRLTRHTTTCTSFWYKFLNRVSPA